MDNIIKKAPNNIHKNCPQIPSKIPMGWLKVYWGMFSVINTISFFSNRVSFDWVLEGLNIPQVPFKDPLGILKGLLGRFISFSEDP